MSKEARTGQIINKPFLCQYYDFDTGVLCSNNTFRKELITAYVQEKTTDKFYKEIVVDIVLRCTKCGHIQDIRVVDDGGHSKGKIIIEDIDR